jgi:hypothetical protein
MDKRVFDKVALRPGFTCVHVCMGKHAQVNTHTSHHLQWTGKVGVALAVGKQPIVIKVQMSERARFKTPKI